MIAPPRVATWLLASIVAASERDAVVGDLCEEFRVHVAPRRGVRRARWWYRWQVARSLGPLLRRSWERVSVSRASAAIVSAALIAAAPASALVLLRTFVLQQVPLKTTTEASVAFVLVLFATASLAGTLGFAAAIRVLNANASKR